MPNKPPLLLPSLPTNSTISCTPISSVSNNYLTVNLPFVPLVWLSNSSIYSNLQLSAVFYVPLFDVQRYRQLCHWSPIAKIVPFGNQNFMSTSPSDHISSLMDSHSHRYPKTVLTLFRRLLNISFLTICLLCKTIILWSNNLFVLKTFLIEFDWSKSYQMIIMTIMMRYLIKYWSKLLFELLYKVIVR